MNSKIALLIASAAAAVLFAAEQPKKEVNELEKLKAKVLLLEGRIDQLEARIAGLAQTTRTRFQLPSPDAEPDKFAPPNIGSREVNGLRIYTVPLGQNPGADAR